jgi:hypothetical protein
MSVCRVAQFVGSASAPYISSFIASSLFSSYLCHLLIFGLCITAMLMSQALESIHTHVTHFATTHSSYIGHASQSQHIMPCTSTPCTRHFASSHFEYFGNRRGHTNRNTFVDLLICSLMNSLIYVSIHQICM